MHCFGLQHFPRFVVDNFDFAVRDGDDVEVFDDDTKETFQCKFRTSIGPTGYVLRYLTRGWYQYVRSKELSPGDHIVFGVENPVENLVLTVVRG